MLLHKPTEVKVCPGGQGAKAGGTNARSTYRGGKACSESADGVWHPPCVGMPHAALQGTSAQAAGPVCYPPDTLTCQESSTSCTQDGQVGAGPVGAGQVGARQGRTCTSAGSQGSMAGALASQPARMQFLLANVQSADGLGQQERRAAHQVWRFEVSMHDGG